VQCIRSTSARSFFYYFSNFLLKFYVNRCGPCKVLGPALEDMAIKSGGMFRLVKINSDDEKPVSQALEVTALPSVYGIRDGKIVHMFQGMPKSEDMMRNFMMGLFGAAPFSPLVTTEESEKYEELTNKLIKASGSASFSFAAREKLTDRMIMKLDNLVQDDSVPDVEGAATLIRTFLSNIVNNPYDQKYRKINLENKAVASKIGVNSSCLAVLKTVGYSKSGSEMIVGKGKKVINVAPLVVAKDCIDKWIQRNRNEMATAARKRKDEIDHARLIDEKGDVDNDDDESEEEIEEVDPLSCRLKLRIDGKNEMHDTVLHRDDQLTKVLDELGVHWEEEDEVQITCAARRMVVKSSDREAMKKTLGEHGLMPAANIVVKVGGSSTAKTSNLKERAAGKKIRKTGSHTMQSIGVYSKNDNNKMELIDGGGGTMYEQDISDDEDEVEDKKDDENETEAEATSPKDSSEQEESTRAENDTDE
jgi:thiol-disulfide isomerase/thioredoxin